MLLNILEENGGRVLEMLGMVCWIIARKRVTLARKVLRDKKRLNYDNF